jgi:hypothetical protein
MANQAVYIASITWVGLLANSCDRAALLGLGTALVAIASCLTGAIIGDIAQDHSARWPVIVMLGSQHGRHHRCPARAVRVRSRQ